MWRSMPASNWCRSKKLQSTGERKRANIKTNSIAYISKTCDVSMCTDGCIHASLHSPSIKLDVCVCMCAVGWHVAGYSNQRTDTVIDSSKVERQNEKGNNTATS